MQRSHEQPHVELVVDLSDSSAVGVASLDGDGTIRAVNSGFADLVGGLARVGESFFDTFDDEAGTLRRACAAVAATGRPGRGAIETVIRLPGGVHRAAEVRTAKDSDGVTVTIIDRAAHIEAEAESARLRAIFEDIGELVGIMAPDGTVLSMNAAATAFFGRPPVARGLFQFVPPDGVDALFQEILPALLSTGRWDGEVDLLRHDGSRVPHHVTLRRHTDPSGDDYWWAIARDRSVARQAAEADALRRANADKDQFIAGVSHELRTPLTTVRGFADILASGTVPPDEAKDFVEIIRHEAYAMSAIVEDLLVAARVEAGRISIVPALLDMRSVVDDVIGALPGADRTVANRLAHGVVATGDVMRCRQVVRNLVTNSIRHGGDQVWVEGQADGDLLYLHVCDDGPGIEPDLREAIFDPYVSRPNDGMRPESVGLGLTVSRQLARLMGGDVLYSYAGHSRFTLVLPVPTDDAG